jgi:hypothetical protein
MKQVFKGFEKRALEKTSSIKTLLGFGRSLKKEFTPVLMDSPAQAAQMGVEQEDIEEGLAKIKRLRKRLRD